MASLYDYEIGTTSSTTNVEELTTPLPAPRSEYIEFTAPQELANGGIRGGGWVLATWTFGFLTSAQLAQLRTFCAEKYSVVYIRTLDEDDPYPNWVYKTGKMIWPDGPLTKRNGRYQDIAVIFRALTTFTPP